MERITFAICSHPLIGKQKFILEQILFSPVYIHYHFARADERNTFLMLFISSNLISDFLVLLVEIYVMT